MPKILALGSGGAAAAGTVTAPVALTNNVIPKGTAAATVANSSLTDTGTLLSTTDPQFNIGPADTASNGILGLNGKTSGTATLTAPAIAGTTTNPIVSSNSFQAPNMGVGTIYQSGNLGDLSVARNGTSGAVFFGSSGAYYLYFNGGVITLGGVNTSFIPGGDNGMDIGSASARIKNFYLGSKILHYNSIATVDNGVPSELGHLDLVAQSTAITATTIYTPTATGRFRISVYEKVTTAASVSSVLGGATGTVLTFTDGTDSVAQSITMGLDNQGGTLALTNNGNTTTTSLNGSAYIYAKTGVAIQIAVGYTSVNAGEMVFALRATCEAL